MNLPKFSIRIVQKRTARDLKPFHRRADPAKGPRPGPQIAASDGPLERQPRRMHVAFFQPPLQGTARKVYRYHKAEPCIPLGRALALARSMAIAHAILQAASDRTCDFGAATGNPSLRGVL